MVKPDIIVYKQHGAEVFVGLDCNECDWVLEDCGLEGMGGAQGEAVQADRDVGGDESHVQEGFEW